MRKFAMMAASVLVVGLFAGCGADDETGPADASGTSASSHPETEPEGSAATTEATDPTCASVWSAGERLPRPYRGCFDEARDEWVPAEVWHCSTGQRIVTFGDSFYAVRGESIVETSTSLQDDAEFAEMMAVCTA